VGGITTLLGRAAGGEVGPNDFVWEERGGFLLDVVVGRRVLFVASRGDPGQSGGAKKSDVYRARVRLTRSGRPLSIAALYDLTQTPDGADSELAAFGRHAAFATSAYGAVESVTLLDLSGDARDRQARTWSERLRASAESWLDTGDARGIGRTEIVFDRPPPIARLELTGESLVMALGQEGAPAALDTATRVLNTGGNDEFGARVQALPHAVRPLEDVAVRLAVTAFGAGPTDAIVDLAHRVGASYVAVRNLFRSPERSMHSGAIAAPASASFDWPPAPLAVPISPPLPGEGQWRQPSVAFLPLAQSEAGAAPYVLETAIRPDPDRRRLVVHLATMDMRQLELGIVPGFDAPRPTVGPHGSGRMRVATRVMAKATSPPGAKGRQGESRAPQPIVAVFDGGIGSRRPPSLEAARGLVVQGHVLSPPLAAMPSIAARDDGWLAFGPWLAPELDALARAGVTSLWQGPPLLEFQDAAPVEGWADLVDRSAICRTRTGYLTYAWAKDVSAATLERALVVAGCDRALHLGRSPHRTGFAYVRLGDEGPDDADFAALAPAMTLERGQAAGASADALFFLRLRDPLPASAIELPWTADEGRQPPPSWLSAVHGAVATNLGAQVRLVAFARGRYLWRLRAGLKELAYRGSGEFLTRLDDSEFAAVGAAIGVGAGRRKTPRGFATSGAAGRAFRGDAGVLVASRDGIALVRSDGFVAPPDADATELPLTAEEGSLRPEAREVGSMRTRGAACVLADGTFVVATTTFDSDEATTKSLLDIGCRRVVALDRGSHMAAFVHRSGADPAPQLRYDASALYAVEVPMRGPVHRLEEVLH
jgi:hypothetical protein